MTKKTYKFHTKFLSSPRLWIERIVIAIALIAGLEMLWIGSSGGSAIKIAFEIVATTAFIIIPTDELAFDKENFYFIEKSLVPHLTRIKRFELSRIQNIKVGIFRFEGVYWGFSTRIEIWFVDGSTATIRTNIAKPYVSKVMKDVIDLRDHILPKR